MNKIKYLKLRKILLLLLITYLILLIIRMCNILEICCTIINLISPIFFGFAISWILKPIVLYLNKYISEKLSIPITYSILIVIISIISYFFIPVLIKEVKNIIPFIIDSFNKILRQRVHRCCLVSPRHPLLQTPSCLLLPSRKFLVHLILKISCLIFFIVFLFLIIFW